MIESGKIPLEMTLLGVSLVKGDGSELALQMSMSLAENKADLKVVLEVDPCLCRDSPQFVNKYEPSQNKD
ncbi:MAG TPA: hypothetical protein VLL52_25930 [Anaerolineae bacterium]|nr:hypothetical protein [Anaerolineae bacterium]